MISKIKQKLKNKFFELTRDVSHLKEGVNIGHEWYGKDYSGFYIHPDVLNNTSVFYSFGIGEDISFDRMMIEKHGCEGHGFDPTPKSINWINGQKIPNNFYFHEYGISTETGTVNFYLPVILDNVSGSSVNHTNVSEHRIVEVPMKCLSDIIKELGHDHIDVLKIDIEGSEYDLISDICNCEIPINQILIEFHDRFFKEKSKKSQVAIKKLRDSGYEIFGVSKSFEEVSLIRKEIIKL